MLPDNAKILMRFAAVLTLLLAVPCHAMKVITVPQTCPIGGEKFSAVVVLSSTSFGTYFDGKPYGYIAAPWPLVRCPGNGFVLYKEYFDAREIAKLKPFVESDEYQALAKRETDHYLAAHLQRFMGASPKQIGWTLLRATWEASPKQYPRYAREALPNFRKICPDGAMPNVAWMQCQMISGELERRLCMFDVAAARFARLAPLMPALSLEDRSLRPILSRTITAQRRLVSAKNSDASRLEEEKPAAVPR